MAYNKDTGLYEGFIYCITNNINGKKYIGQTTKTIMFRWQQHQYRSTVKKYTQHLYNSFNKYGIENFKIKQIDIISSNTTEDLKNNLDKLEIRYIDYFNTFTPNGYNMTNGADFNPTYLTSSKVMLLDLNYSILNSFKSINEAHSVTKIAWSAIKKSCSTYKIDFKKGLLFCYENELQKVINEKPYKNIGAKNKFCKYDLDGNLIKVYDSITELMKDNNLSSSGAIYMACDKLINNSHGFLWSYYNEKPNKYNDKTIKTMKTVYQYDLQFNYIQSFKSLSDACRCVGLKQKTSISSVCNGKTFQSQGYIWRYAGDNDDNKFLYYEKMGYMKQVLQISKTGKVLSRYDNILIASNKTNIDKKQIYIACNSKIINNAGDYIWAYV